MKLTRRNFLKIGAASGALSGIASQFGVLGSALGDELIEGGADVSGGAEGVKGQPRKAVHTVCLQCGNNDGIIGFVEDGRIVKVEGNPRHPNARGRCCAKGQAGHQNTYDPYRIKWPMVRDPKDRGKADAWERTTWEEAVDIVAEKLIKFNDEGDPGKYLFHQGRNRFPAFTKRFNNAYGTGHTFNHTSVCESSLKVGWEVSFGQDFFIGDAIHSKYIMSFGENINEAAYMHHAQPQRIIEGRVDNNAKFVVFDPRLSNTAAQADEWFPLIPGSDGAICLAMCNVIMEAGLADTDFVNTWTNVKANELGEYLKTFTPEWAEEISSIPAEDIRRVAIEYAKNQPGYARAYNGLSSGVNGGQCARAVALLNAIVGNLDRRGGACLVKGGGLGKFEPEPPGPEGEFPLRELIHEEYPLAHHGADHLLPNALEETGYKVGLYLLHQYNPVFVNPDRQKWRDVLSNPEHIEYTVDFSPFWSETVQDCVDLVIPDVSYLERLHVHSMPPLEEFPYIHLYQPVVEPLFESRNMYDTMLAIAKKVPHMAQYFQFDTVEEYIQGIVEDEWGPGSYDILKRDGVLIPNQPDGTYKRFDQLTPEELDAMRMYDTPYQQIPADKLAEMRAGGSVFPAADGPIKDEKGEKVQGVIIGGVAYQGFPTGNGLYNVDVPEIEEKLHDRPKGLNRMPDYQAVPRIENRREDEFIMTVSGKWNVHTQSRTQNQWMLTEIQPSSPLWIHTTAAKKLGLDEGDKVVLESEFASKQTEARVHITEGINPAVVWMATSFGHWAYGDHAAKGKDPTDTGKDKRDMWFMKRKFGGQNTKVGDFDLRSKTPNGEDALGWSGAWIIPNDRESTCPLGGEYAWNSHLVKIRKA